MAKNLQSMLKYDVRISVNNVSQEDLDGLGLTQKLEMLIKLVKQTGVEAVMQKTPQITPEIKAELTERVKEYFANHIYAGYTRPFELVELRPCHTNSLYAIPNGIEEELEEDDVWDKGLNEIGSEINMAIVLPYWCYSK